MSDKEAKYYSRMIAFTTGTLSPRLNSSGEVHLYSRTTVEKKLESKLTGKTIQALITKPKLLDDPFSHPPWFSVLSYTRHGAKQKRTIVDDDDDDEEDDIYMESGNVVADDSTSVVIKKRTRAEMKSSDPVVPIHSASGGVSLDEIKKKFNADATLLVTEVQKPSSDEKPSSQPTLSTNITHSQSMSNHKTCNSAIGDENSSFVGVETAAKRSRLNLSLPYAVNNTSLNYGKTTSDVIGDGMPSGARSGLRTTLSQVRQSQSSQCSGIASVDVEVSNKEPSTGKSHYDQWMAAHDVCL